MLTRRLLDAVSHRDGQKPGADQQVVQELLRHLDEALQDAERGFTVAFIVAAMQWVGHRDLFTLIRGIVWLNLLTCSRRACCRSAPRCCPAITRTRSRCACSA